MLGTLIRFLVVLLVSLAFWVLANLVLGTQEPWDSPYYLRFYLLALGLCATFGYFFEERPMLWAVIVVFAQLPVMGLSTGRLIAPLMVIGILLLMIQSLPAILIAIAASIARKRQPRI